MSIDTKSSLDQIVRRLNEKSVTVPIHWTRPELLIWYNEALTELNLIAGEIRGQLLVNLVPTDFIYDLTADQAVAPLAIMVNGTYLRKQSIENMDCQDDFELVTPGTPKIWSPLGTTKIIVYPPPRVAMDAVVDAIILHTPVLDLSTSIPPIREEYIGAIEDYVVSRAMFKESGPELDQQNASSYQWFLEVTKGLELRNRIRTRPGWKTTPESKTSETTLGQATEETA